MLYNILLGMALGGLVFFWVGFVFGCAWNARDRPEPPAPVEDPNAAPELLPKHHHNVIPPPRQPPRRRTQWDPPVTEADLHRPRE